MNQNDRKTKISDTIGEIDDKYVSEADKAWQESQTKEIGWNPESERKPLRLPRRNGWIVAVAAALAVALLGASAVVITTEAREYKAAVTFFEENELPTEGLTRAEIKEVYRDITTRRFVSPKTEELIRERVAGVMILQDEPTPEDLAKAWDFDWSKWKDSLRTSGYSYEIQITEKRNQESGYDEFEKSIVECYESSELTWTAEISDFAVQRCFHIAEGTVVWGYENLPMRSTADTYRWISWLGLVNDQGTVLWTKPLEHGFEQEYIAGVVDNGDGTLAVISCGSLSELVLSQYDLTGKERSSFTNDSFTNGAAMDAIRVEDGYLVRVEQSREKYRAHMVRIDRKANVLEAYDYESEDELYYLTAMIQYGGKIYLSGYTVPRQENTDGSRSSEILNIWKRIMEKGPGDPEINEWLTPLARANYTAILLVCDSDIGKPQAFWSVEGSLGGALSVNGAGELEWDVESIESTFTSAFSSFSIGGTCKVFRYIFDAKGSLLEQKDTGETAVYRR